MNARPAIIFFGLAALALYAYTRTRQGQQVAADALGGIIVSATKVTTAVKNTFTPRGIRNHNPGNIEWIADAAKRWRGMIAADGRYGIFDTPANGVRAIGGELKASIRKGHTIAQAIYEWAPPVENDSDAYVGAVAKAVGAASASRLTSDMLPAVALAIIKHENGQQPYDPALVAQWVYA